MMNTLKKFKSDMSNTDFINLILDLDNIDNGSLCEDDDHFISDFYNKLYTICKSNIDLNINNKMYLPNRGETIGDFMNFLRMIHI